MSVQGHSDPPFPKTKGSTTLAFPGRAQNQQNQPWQQGTVSSLQCVLAPSPKQKAMQDQMETMEYIGKVWGNSRIKMKAQGPVSEITETRIYTRDSGHPLQGAMWINSSRSHNHLKFKIKGEWF